MGKKNNTMNLLCSVALLVVTLGVFGPLEVYLSNSGDIWFSFSDVIKIAALISGVMILFFGLLGLLLKRRARQWIGVIAFILGASLFVQGTFLNIDFGALDGKSIEWNKYVFQSIINTIIWLVIAAVGIIVFLRKERLFSIIQIIGSGMILLIEAITLIFMMLSAGGTQQTNNSPFYLSTEGIYTIGKNNIVVFVVDTFDEAFFQKAEEQSEEYDTVFQDFTHYDNAAVAAATTKAALPAILTGKAYPGGINYQDYINQAFDSDGLYTTLHQENYDTRIYTDSGFMAENAADRIANQTEIGYKVSSYSGLTLKYEQLTLFKYLPHIIKPLVWMYTGDLEEFKSGAEEEAYTLDDIKFYQGLVKNGIKVTSGRSFRLYHLRGCHPPYIYNREVKMSEGSDVMEQTRGALKIVTDYIEKLKNCGVYDETTIIVMADHGEIHKQFPMDNKAHGILLVKEAGQKAEIMKTSSLPVSYWDLHDELFSAINPEKGKKFSETADTERSRVYYTYTTEHGAVIWKEYLINGNLNEKGTVTETGQVFKPNQKKQDYQYGQELSFGKEAKAVRYIISGISASDGGSHSWTNSRSVIFEFPLESTPRNNLLITLKCADVYKEAGPQVLYMYANKTLYDVKILEKGGAYQFVIPGISVGEDKKLELQMILPYAASPKKLYGAGKRADGRTLGLALSGLTIEETDQEATEIKIHEIIQDEEYRFAEGEKEANSFFLKGLSKQEKGGFSWTNGNHVIMEAVLSETTSNDLEVTFSLGKIFNNSQHCRIRTGDTILFDETVSGDDREIKFTIPNDCLINGKEIHLMAELPDASSPKELGTGEDKRTVALALTRMIIHEKDKDLLDN